MLQRDDKGNAKLSAAGQGVSPLPAPFRIPDRADSAPDRALDTLATTTSGAPLFESFDANQTILAAAMREGSKLIDRGNDDRSGLENIAHGIRPLLVRLDVWHAGRSKLVDQLLTVTRSGSAGAYSYKLADRNAYAIAIAALPWINDQIDAHRNDLAAWTDGLSGRLATIMQHPLAANVIDLLDASWPELDASGEFTKVSATLLNETDHPKEFRGMLVAAADMLTLLQNDQDLSPAIQFAALGLAPNAFDAVSGTGEPDVVNSAAYAALELTRDVIRQQRAAHPDAQFTTVAKLLRNFVLSDGAARSPLEVIFDATADVNRIDTAAPTEQTLTPDENRQVLKNVSLFVHDDNDEKQSLERLYQVIQARSLKGN